ncbi:MAG: TlpA disulfide reductase family protein [Mycobacterium sp.]|jgi:thiol-disulfide isomerase/thioredoxin
MTGHRLLRRSGLAALALVALLLSACAGADSEGSVSDAGFVAGDGSITAIAASERVDAPSLEGELMSGGTWSLAQERGRVVVLNVWASWCAPCRAEAPILQSLWEEYGDDGVSFIGLNTRDSPATANSFEKAYGITYPSVVDSDGRLQLRFSGIAPPQAIPTTLVIDRDGKVAGRILGRASESTLRGLIEPLLASASDPSPSTATPTATDD